MSQTISKTETYKFTDANGQTDTITVTESTTAKAVSTYGTGYAVSKITGSIGGAAITGEVGTGGKAQQDTLAIYDNTIFTGTNGDKGNTNGLDFRGLEFMAGGIENNVYSSGGKFYLLSPNTTGLGTPLTLASVTVSCFCPGTMVLTEHGERAIETLAIGDMVTTTTGKSAPIRWIGRQTVSTTFGDPLRVLPIRIKAGALGEGVPSRDLLLSPDHALLVDNVLIQAGALVNGVSVTREAQVPEIFTYYHVELGDHSLILAENTPAETFVDNVDRMNFDNWAEHEALVGDTAIVEMDLPRAKSTRQVPSATRARLAARAQALTGALQAA